MKCETQCHSGQKSPCYLVAELEAEPVLGFSIQCLLTYIPARRRWD